MIKCFWFDRSFRSPEEVMLTPRDVYLTFHWRRSPVHSHEARVFFPRSRRRRAPRRLSETHAGAVVCIIAAIQRHTTQHGEAKLPVQFFHQVSAAGLQAEAESLADRGGPALLRTEVQLLSEGAS